MIANSERLKQEALELPEADRAELARLIESFDESEDPHSARAAWDEELRRRVERVKQGESHLRTAHQALEEIRDKYK